MTPKLPQSDARATPVVGVIGLGEMGGPMARHMLAGGFRVIGYDLRPEALAALEALGGKPAASVPALARDCDIVIVIIIDDDQVRSACTGADGIFANARPGTVTAVMSSVSPDLCVELDRSATAAGMHFIDAPIVRGAAAAAAGKLLMLLGGSKEVVERCLPAFGCFASDHAHLGGPGAGQVGKMVNNMILWAAVVANHEGFRFARSMDIDVDLLRETLKASAADSWVLRTWDVITQQKHWWDQKDLASMLETAARHDADLPLTGTLKELMKPLRPEVAQTLFRKPGGAAP